MRQDAYDRLQEQSRREFGNRRNFQDESNRDEFNRPQNLSSSRSDYRDNGGDDRGWFERASNEVSSWFGGDDRDNRNHTRNARDRNINEYDGNSYHSYPSGYTPKEANPYYPTTNRIYERDDRRSERDDFPNRNNQSNQNRNFNQSRGFASMGNQNYQQQQGQQNRWRDWHDTRAGDLMSRNVATVHPNDTVQRAARLMRDEDCGALPVIDRQGQMIGMITDRDITVRLVADGADPRFAQVQDCMTDEVFACHVNDPIEHCIRAMKEHQIRRLAIVNDRNQLLGIVSQSDLARHADMNKQQGERHAITDMIAGVSEPSNSAYR
ncbi:MAG: CBS domain-containing protein [Acidobacteriota bacterium]|nr:CBS domain-containing protein [Acidobacteriota bacterium]